MRGRGFALRVANNSRADELVGFAALVSVFYRANRIGRAVPDALRQQFVGLLHARPTVISVHRKVAPHDRADATAASLHHLFEQARNVAQTRLRRRVAAIGEDVKHDFIAFQTVARGHFEQREIMPFRSVNVAV